MNKDQSAGALIRAGFLTAVGTALFWGGAVAIATLLTPAATRQKLVITSPKPPCGCGAGCDGA